MKKKMIGAFVVPTIVIGGFLAIAYWLKEGF